MHLLLIEDEEIIAKNIQRMLEARGFTVDTIPNAHKALNRVLLYREVYALILLDLGLPDMDGAALTAKLREEGIKNPIIVLTGRSDTKSKVDLLNAGADDYVVKPFSSDELIARINSILRRPTAVKPTVEVLGHFSIDTAAHRVKYQETEIPLTAKEYSLFECLIRKSGEIVTRDELASGTWNFESVAWSNVLDVHMKNLRKKLSITTPAPRIETLRGIGYRLIVEV